MKLPMTLSNGNRHPGRLLTAAALVLVALSAGCQSTADESSTSSVPSEPLATSSPSEQPSIPVVTAEPSEAPASPGEQGSGAWERVLTASADGGMVARPVVRGTSGYLMAADEFQVVVEGGPRLAEHHFWRSADGRTWDAVEPPLEKEDWLHVVTTSRSGDFLVIVGVPEGPPGSGTMRTVLRRSSDGVTWEDVESGLPDDFQVFSVDHGARGSLLVGLQYLPGNDLGAWLSADGIRWEKVLELDGGDRWLVADDGGAGDEGYVVPFWVTEGESHRYLVRASADGRTWIQSGEEPFGAVDPGFRPTPFVAPLGPDWVAFLHRPDGSVQTWLSANGLDWRAGPVIERDEEAHAFTPVTGVADGVLYFSTVGWQSFPATDVGIWTTTDGQAWEPLDLGEPGYLGGVASHDDLVVLSVTHVGEDGRLDVGIWIRPGS